MTAGINLCLKALNAHAFMWESCFLCALILAGKWSFEKKKSAMKEAQMMLRIPRNCDPVLLQPLNLIAAYCLGAWIVRAM